MKQNRSTGLVGELQIGDINDCAAVFSALTRGGSIGVPEFDDFVSVGRALEILNQVQSFEICPVVAGQDDSPGFHGNYIVLIAKRSGDTSEASELGTIAAWNGVFPVPVSEVEDTLSAGKGWSPYLSIAEFSLDPENGIFQTAGFNTVFGWNAAETLIRRFAPAS